jgi:hypothetical protein
MTLNRTATGILVLLLLAVTLIGAAACDGVGIFSGSSTGQTPGPASSRVPVTNTAVLAGSVGPNTLRIYEPSQGAQIAEKVTVRGEGIAFENTINVQVVANGATLGQTTVTTDAPPGDVGTFETVVDIAATRDDADGSIVIYTTSPKDGSVDQRAVVPVRVLAHGRVTPTSAYTTQPTIRISPLRGRAGTEITVVGGGFPPASTVEIRLGTLNSGANSQVYATTQVGQHGTIQVSFIMPHNWPNGEPIIIPRLVVLASTPDYLVKATAEFSYELVRAPQLTPTPGSRGEADALAWGALSLPERPRAMRAMTTFR